MAPTRPGEKPAPRPEAAGQMGRVITLPLARHRVLFVSDSALATQIAASFFELKAGPLARSVAVCTSEVAELSRRERAVMAELGIDPDQIILEAPSDDLARGVVQIVVLGSSTRYDPPPGVRAPVERWPLDEPTHRGIDGLERLRLIRDGIEAHLDTMVALMNLDASAAGRLSNRD